MKKERPEVSARLSVFCEYLERLPDAERKAIQKAERSYLDGCVTSERDQLALSYQESMGGYSETPAGPYRSMLTAGGFYGRVT